VIICFFKRQVEILFKLKSFEVDMSFKRIRDDNTNEIVFAAFLLKLNKGE
jgi:hypothetical protein